MERATIFVHVNYQDSYTHPIIQEAVTSVLASLKYTLVDSADDLPSPQSPFLQITAYESISFSQLLEHPTTSMACSYVIRKALIRKHYLAHTVHSYLTKQPHSDLVGHVPMTVDFEVDYAEFLDEALVEAYELHEVFARNGGKAACDRDWWILKPSMSDRGQGIRLFSTEKELYDVFAEWEQDQSDSEDEDEAAETPQDNEEYAEGAAAVEPEKHYSVKTEKGIVTSQLRHFVAQPYIPPLLLAEYRNRKFHIRTYVVCIGALRVYVFKEMLALFASVPYQNPGTENVLSEVDGVESYHENIDMRPHLTNTCLQTSAPNQSATDPSARKAIPFRNIDASNLGPWAVDSIYEQIFSITSHVFRAAVAQPTNFQPLPNAFEIFGVDWLVDPDLQVHLLEFNAYPDFAQSGPEGKTLIDGLWRGVLETVVKGDGEGVPGFFGNLVCQERGTASEKEHQTQNWGLKKVLDLDLGRR